MSKVDTISDQKERFFSIDEYGSNYTQVLRSLHKFLKPKRYFEIGTLSGDTLALSECMSLAVDPKFRLKDGNVGIKPACLLFQMTSDDFFAECDPTMLLGGPIDLAFLDGMHWYEFLLRDFMNVERKCKRNSVIVLHDCMPTDSHVARRHSEDQTFAKFTDKLGWWAGDVWKTVAILMEYRPDLVIYGSKVAPTGLVLITNLDPTCRSLDQDYFEAVKKFSGTGLDSERMMEFFEKLQLLSPHEVTTEKLLAPMFWL